MPPGRVAAALLGCGALLQPGAAACDGRGEKIVRASYTAANTRTDTRATGHDEYVV
jgi:hypothetical protein